MKSKLVLITLLLSFSILIKTNGQSLNIPPLNFKANLDTSFHPFSLLKSKKNIFLEKPVFSNYTNTSPLSSLNQFPKARLIDSNNNFHIYQLPVDNMICLVPKNNSYNKMYTGQFNTNKSATKPVDMPNAFKKQDWIQKRKSSK